MFAIFCLLLYMILYIVNRRFDNKSCRFVYEYIGHYFKTGYFSWFNMMLISRLNENLRVDNKKLCSSIWMHLYAWTVPLLFVVIYIFYQNLNWYIPMLILWVINVLLIIVIIYSLKYDIRTIKFLIWRRNYYRSWLLVRLFMGAGLFWVFGSTYRIPIFASLFALQGVMIFLVMVVYRNYAKRRLGGRGCGHCCFPKRWKQLPKFDEDDIHKDLLYQSEEKDCTILLDFGIN